MEELDLDFDDLEWDLDPTLLYLYKIQNSKEYFLRDVVDGKTVWTAHMARAYGFGTEQEVEEFKQKYLPGRKDFNITRR